MTLRSEGEIIMVDVHSPEQRSYNMSMIKGKDTKPEEKVRRYLFARGFRYEKKSYGISISNCAFNSVVCSNNTREE